ncbi:hypothetical protein DFH06DRAFT_1171936 [Mycena polygramma]|nr:hypothetical protein DFH06DRAFT_1171936 [Mycena polygramma]
MDSIPSELWTDVFAFACTDDGYTGRALSRVSRAVHVTSKPLKYQSLCVVGLDQLLKLLAVLSELSPGERKTKYLFVAGLDTAGDLDCSAEMRRIFHADPGTHLGEQALYRLLDLVSPRLLTLHLHHTSALRQSLLPDVDLPVLRELTLHGPFRSLPAVLPPHRSFPALRRLYICHCAFYPGDFLQQIVHAAPTLTHLRVPQSTFPPYDIQVALDILQPAPSAGEPVYLPRSLEKLVIELDPVANSLDSCTGQIRARQFAKKYQKISGSDSRVCLEDGQSGWMPVDQARQRWLDGHDPFLAALDLDSTKLFGHSDM